MSEYSNVMLVGSNGETFDSNNVSFCVLPHPRYGPITFLKSKGKIYEIQKVQPRKFGSWFINQRVLSDCSYLMVSKFDIRFLILPFFENFGDKYRPLDQIIASVEGCDRIGLENCDDWNLSEICDINDKLGEDMILYRINMEKVLEWLRSKVTSAIEVISSQRRRKAADSLLAQTFNSSAQSNTTASSPSQIDEGCVINFLFALHTDLSSDRWKQRRHKNCTCYLSRLSHRIDVCKTSGDLWNDYRCRFVGKRGLLVG